MAVVGHGGSRQGHGLPCMQLRWLSTSRLWVYTVPAQHLGGSALLCAPDPLALSSTPAVPSRLEVQAGMRLTGVQIQLTIRGAFCCSTAALLLSPPLWQLTCTKLSPTPAMLLHQHLQIPAHNAHPHAAVHLLNTIRCASPALPQEFFEPALKDDVHVVALPATKEGVDVEQFKQSSGGLCWCYERC